MIPRIIHYCWFGKGKKDNLSQRCIASWRKFCPDYKIIEWNEDNCDIGDSIFASEAYAKKKWAFVSDYFRLKAMYEYGGIYMDTDVELFKNIDRFLEDNAFVGYVDDTYIGSGMFGCSKGNEFCKQLLDYYEGRHFLNDDGTLNDIPNNQIYTMICLERLGFNFGNDRILCGNTKVYPSDFFSPFKKITIGNPDHIYRFSNFDCTDNTYAIHYTVYSWAGSKLTIREKGKNLLHQSVRLILPRKLYFKLKKNSMLKKMKDRVRV